MAFELFSIIGRLAVEGLDQTRAKLGEVQTSLQGFSDKASNGFSNFNNKVQSANGVIQAHSGQITQLGGVMTGLGATITGLGGVVVSMGTSFDTQMRRVGSLTQATGADFAALRTTAKDLGATTAFSATQAADAMGFLAQAGFKTDQILGSMEGTLNLAAASQIDLATAADISSNILSGFGLKAEDLSGKVDALVNTVINSNTNMLQLGEGMKYVAPIAAAAGVSLEETATAMGLLGNAGIQGSMAGTSLRGAITRLLSPSDEATESMKRLGLRVKDADGNFVGFRGIVEQLQGSQQKLGNDTQFVTELMEIFGQRAGPGMAALVSQGVTAFDDLQTKVNETGTASKVATDQMAGIGGSFIELKSALEGLAIAILDSGVGDFIQTLIDGATGVVRGLATMNPEILKWGTIIVGAIGAAMTAIGPLLLILPQLSGALATVSGFLAGGAGAGSLSGALAIVTGPIGLTVAAVTGVVSALVLWRKEIAEFLLGVLSALGVNVQGLLGGLDALWSGLKTLAGGIWDLVVAAFQGLTKAAGWVWEKIAGFVDFLRGKGRAEMDKYAASTKDVDKKFDDLKKSTQNLQKEEKKHESSLTKLATAMAEAGDDTSDFSEALDDNEKATKKTKTAVFDLEKALRDLEAQKKRNEKAVEDLAKAATEKLQKSLEDLAPPILALGTNVADAVAVVSQVFTDDLLPGFDSVKSKADAVANETAQAFKDAGIKTKDELVQLATDAETNFGLIKNSGQASATDIDKAWADMLKARKDALIAQGLELPPEEEKTLNALLQKQKDFKTNSIEGPGAVFVEWAKGVKSIVTDLSGELIEKLFTGDFSFGGSFGDKAKAIADSFKSLFIDKAKEHISTFINSGINALMGALDGLIGKLTGSGGLGAALNSVFNLGSSAGAAVTNAAGQVAGTAGQVAGAAGDAAGAATSGAGGAASTAAGAGLTGIVGAVSGVVSAVSGVISNFQLARQETSLNAIEHNTRYTMMYVGEREDGGILGVMFKVLEQLSWGPNVKANGETRDHIATHLGAIAGSTSALLAEVAWGFQTKALEGIRDTSQLILDKMTDIVRLASMNYDEVSTLRALASGFLPDIVGELRALNTNITIQVDNLAVRSDQDVDNIARALFEQAQTAGTSVG